MITALQKGQKRHLCLLLTLFFLTTFISGCSKTVQTTDLVKDQSVDPLQDGCVKSFIHASHIEWTSTPIDRESAEWAIVLSPVFEGRDIDPTVNVFVSKFCIDDIPQNPENEEDLLIFTSDFLTNNGSNGYEYELIQFNSKESSSDSAFLVRPVSPLDAYESREDYQRAIILYNDALYSFVGKGEGSFDSSNSPITMGNLIQHWVESLGGRDISNNRINQLDTYWLYSDERIITDKEKSLTMYQTEENGIYKWIYTYPLATESDQLTFTILQESITDQSLYSMQISTSSDAQYSFQTIDSIYEPDFLLEDINHDGWNDLLLAAEQQIWLWDPRQHLFIPDNQQNLLKATASSD